MLGWTVLNAWMAACWNGSWNVEPLALSVPVSLAELLDEEEELDELPPEEPQAATKAARAAAAPTVAARWMRRLCI